MDDDLVVDVVASLTNMNNKIIDLVSTYRTQLLDAEFTEASAEAMTVEYHRVLLTQIHPSP